MSGWMDELVRGWDGGWEGRWVNGIEGSSIWVWQLWSGSDE